MLACCTRATRLAPRAEARPVGEARRRRDGTVVAQPYVRAGAAACERGPFRLRYPRNLSGHVLGADLGFDLDVPDPSLSQCLFLNSISRCSGSLVVAASLVLNGRNRSALGRL
jgi:hypothetical protein